MVFNKIKRYPSSSTEENNLSIKFIYMLALLVRLLLLRDEFNSLVKLKTQIRSCEMLKVVSRFSIRHGSGDCESFVLTTSPLSWFPDEKESFISELTKSPLTQKQSVVTKRVTIFNHCLV
jgi:hypothetical protein